MRMNINPTDFNPVQENKGFGISASAIGDELKEFMPATELIQSALEMLANTRFKDFGVHR